MNSLKSPPAPRTPKKSSRKKRPLSTLYSPTRFTPEVKKHRTSRKTNRKEWKAWTPAEKRFIIQYIERNSNSNGNINWEECATFMERSLGTKRSAISCQTFFTRMEEEAYDVVSVEHKSTSVQTDITINAREQFAFAKMSEFAQQAETAPDTSQTLHQLLTDSEHTNCMPEDPLPGNRIFLADCSEVCMVNAEKSYHNCNQPIPTTFVNNDNNQQQVRSDPVTLSDHNYIVNRNKPETNKKERTKLNNQNLLQHLR